MLNHYSFLYSFPGANECLWQSEVRQDAKKEKNINIFQQYHSLFHYSILFWNARPWSEKNSIILAYSLFQFLHLSFELPVNSILKLGMCVLSCFSHVWLFATLWTITCQAPLFMGFSIQEYWSVLPCPSPGDLPNPGIEPASLMSPGMAGGSLPLASPIFYHSSHNDCLFKKEKTNSI